MRVAYLYGTYPAPTETFLARDVAALEQAGVQVVPVAFRPGPDGPAPGAVYRPRLGLALWSPPAPLLRAIVSDVRFRPHLAARWVRCAPFARWLARWCQESRIDLVHASWSGLPAVVAWLAAGLGGPPYTVAGHARDVFCRPEAPAAALLGARGVTVCNRAAEAAVRARLPGLGGRLVYHPHGVPLDEWPRRASEPSGPPVVLGVGRLIAKKGFDVLVRAAAALPGVEVRLLGEGPAAGELGALAERCGAAVRLMGRRSPAEVRSALGEATALALPSRVGPAGDRDGLANVLLEALAVGVPVVTTTAGAATDAIADEVSGLLVPPDDPAALARALRRLVDDAALRRRLADAGREVVATRYDARVNGARLASWLRAMSQEGHADGG